MVVNVKVCFPFLKDPAKCKGREKWVGGEGEDIKYSLLLLNFLLGFFHFLIYKEHCFTSKRIIQ